MRFFIFTWIEEIPGLPSVPRTEVIDAENLKAFITWAALHGIVFTMATHSASQVPARRIWRNLMEL